MRNLKCLLAVCMVGLVACSQSDGQSNGPAGGAPAAGAAGQPITNGGAAGVIGGAGSGAGGAASGNGGASGSSATAGSGGNIASSGGGPAGGGTSGGGGFAGSSGGAAAGSTGTAGAPSGAPVFVAVGYCGLRARSINLGATWIDEQTLETSCGDDDKLLRATAFGAGVFVALGYKVFWSPDGKVWTEKPNLENQWLGGVAFGNGMFLATGGGGYCATSSDGKSWSHCQDDVPATTRSVTFGLGKFVAATDGSQWNGPGVWYQSNDGSNWTIQSMGGHVSNQLAFCNGAIVEESACAGAGTGREHATAAGVTVRVNYDNGKLERSTGGAFTAISGAPSGVESVAVGYVP